MNIRKHSGLIIGLAIALVFFIGVVVLLIRVQGQYSQVSKELQKNSRRLEQLNGRDPYPSQENVALEERNLLEMREMYAQMLGSLGQDQVKPLEIEPAQFPTLLEKTVRRLHRQQRDAQITIPERFAFGFDRYLEGALPEEQDIPRLVVQLQTVERVCEMLFESRISELEEVKRDDFDKPLASASSEPVVGRRRRGGAPPPQQTRGAAKVREQKKDPQGLFVCEHFTIVFQARESSVWDVLNEMARSSLFIMVTDVQMESEVPKLFKAKDKAGPVVEWFQELDKSKDQTVKGRPRDLILSHDERVVAGREVVTVTLSFDVYQFASPEDKEAEQ